MALDMKPACETCGRVLSPSGEAFICSYECTFCGPCTEKTHRNACPNCGGELTRRPTRNPARPS